MFSNITPHYDFLNHFLSAGLDITWRKRAVGTMALPAGARVLDLCTGTGDLLLEVARRAGARARLVGADFAQPMLLEALRKTRRKAPRQPMLFLSAESENLPFPDLSFDAVTIAFGVRNLWSTLDLCLKEMARVLRPGGRVYILEMSRPRLPWLRRLYNLYLRTVVTYVGGALARDRPAYRYLAQSIIRFMGPDELRARMLQAGFHEVSYRLYEWGIAALHVGTKGA